MNTRIKFFAGGILILGSAAYLMASSITETGLTWMTTTELASKAAADSSFGKREYKVGAKVVPGSIVRHGSTGRDISFVATDGSRELTVLFKKTPPDTFSDSAEVILTGTMQPDGSFAATELLAKCASRFELAAPTDPAATKYRNTPGYKAASKVGT